MRELVKLHRDFINSQMDHQVKRLMILNVASLIYGIVAYNFLAGVMAVNIENGRTEFKSLIYVSLTMLAYGAVGLSIIKPKHKVLYFRVGTLMCCEFLFLWGIQAMFFSIVEGRETNMFVWLMCMIMVVCFYYVSVIEYLMLYIINVAMCIHMLDTMTHVSFGLGKLINIIVITMLLGISYYAKYFEALRRYKNERALKASMDTRELFAASMNHELRTPLNSIIGNSQILLMRDDLPDEVRGEITAISDSSNNMVQLVNELLDFSRLEAGEFQIIPVDFCLDELQKNIQAMFTNMASERRLKFDVEIEENTPMYLNADARRIQQILTNVISNGIKYTNVGGVKVLISVINSKLHAVVKDTGMGMPKNTIESLYTPFKRIDEDKNTGIQGTGLGMFIVKNLIDQMDGVIACDSEVGVGTTFTIDIPVVVKDTDEKYHKDVASGANEKMAEDKARTREKGWLKGYTILTVDDTSMNNKIISTLLTDTGAEIESMPNAEGCLEYLERKIPDVILLDHMMPGMNGVECLGIIRAKNDDTRKVPVIMMTGNDGEKYEELYREVGANGYLQKPVMLEKLLSEIERVIK